MSNIIFAKQMHHIANGDTSFPLRLYRVYAIIHIRMVSDVTIIVLALIMIASVLFARECAGYDSRYNAGRFFCVKNETLSYFLLPRSLGSRNRVKRLAVDYNKMTYAGAFFYVLNAILIVLIPIILHVIPSLPTAVLETEWFILDTLNAKIVIALTGGLLMSEIIAILIRGIRLASKVQTPPFALQFVFSSVVVLLLAIFCGAIIMLFCLV